MLLPLALAAAEKAAYDSNGRIIALLSGAEDLEVTSQVVAVLPTGKRIPLQVRRENVGARRQSGFSWSQPFTLPDGGRGTLTLTSEETDGVRYSVSLAADSVLDVDAIEFVVDLPRLPFLNGSVAASGAPAVALAPVRAAGLVLFHGDTAALHFAGATPALALDAVFDHATGAAVIDRWDERGRSFQLRAVIAKGPVAGGATASLATTLTLTNRPAAPVPAHLTLDTSAARYRFDGFGGNYCWNNASPIAAYTLANLKSAWARFELKARTWDQHRDNPDDDTKADLENMRRVQQMGIPT